MLNHVIKKRQGVDAMKKTIYISIIVAFFMIIFPYALSFEPEEGFYAEYRICGHSEEDIYPSSAFVLLKEHRKSEIKFLYLEDLIYGYQILDINWNLATVRVCFEGRANATGYNVEQKEVPFRRIFDITVDLDTLEMIDEDGAWGKWLFWIKLGSYDWREYPIMKDYNGGGQVNG